MCRLVARGRESFVSFFKRDLDERCLATFRPFHGWLDSISKSLVVHPRIGAGNDGTTLSKPRKPFLAAAGLTRLSY